MTAFFHWLDQHPGLPLNLALLGTLALGAWIAGTLWCEARGRSSRWTTPGFAVLTLLFLLGWRWPFLLSAGEYNPDESQFIAGAMALARDPVFWRSVDGVTSGPLDFFALLPLHALGVPLDYFGARLTALLLTWALLLLLYRTFRAQASAGAAQLAVLPGAVFFAAAVHADFVHYSSELAPLALLALAISLLERRPLVAAGLAGCLPWAKLQALPLAAALVGWQVWCAARENSSGAARVRRWAALAAAAAAPTVVVLAAVAATGQLEHFYRRFVLQNFAYVHDGLPLSRVARELHRFATESGHFYPWIAAVLLLLGGLALIQARQRPGPPDPAWRACTQQARERGFIVSWVGAILLFVLGAGTIQVDRTRPLPRTFWLGALLTAAAAVCIVTPARSSLHYALFLTVPLTFWTGALLCDLWARGLVRPALTSLAVAAALLPLQARLALPAPTILGRLEENWRHPSTAVGEVLQHWRQPGARLALWGWMSYAYVESGLPQATQDTVSQWCILPVAQRDYYRATYLADFQRNRPEVFVDAVGPGAPFFTDRPRQGHETFPALAAEVKRDYQLVVDLQLARVYVRRDVFARHPLSPAELRRLVARGRVDYGSPTPPDTTQPADLPQDRINGRPVVMIAPPAQLAWKLTGMERSVELVFGMHPKSYDEGNTDGAEFIAELLLPGRPPLQVFHRRLDPLHEPSYRGPQRADVDLPPYPDGATFIVRTTAGNPGNDSWDWVYLSSTRFTRSPFYSLRQFPGFRRVPTSLDCAYPYLVNLNPDWLLMLPPPAALTFVLDGDERQLNFSFGLAEGSYTGPGQTDGAIFIAELWSANREPRTLYQRKLDPLGHPADRGRQSADLILPPGLQAGDRIVLRIDPGANTSWDWTYVSALDLR